MDRKSLVGSKEYITAGIQIQLYRLIEDYLKKNNLTKTQFAEQIGVSKGYVSQVLNGDFDHKLSKFVELSLAAKWIPVVSFTDLDEYVKNDAKHRNYSSMFSGTVSCILPANKNIDDPKSFEPASISTSYQLSLS